MSSFRAKLTLLVLFTTVVTGTFVGGVMLTRNYFRLQEVSLQHFNAEADVVASQAGFPLYENDPDAATRKLQAMAAVPEIGAVYVYDNDGALFASFVRGNGDSERLKPGFTQRESTRWLIINGKPIEYEGTTVGTFDLTYDMEPLFNRLRANIVAGITLTLATTLLALFLTLRVLRTISRPVAALAETARHVATEKDYSVRARRFGTDDELDTLITGFNTMLDEIERANVERTSLLERERVARAEAERATRIKDEFVATLSHELRTPLAAVLGWTQMLQKRSLPPEETGRAVEVIERNARLQMRMVEDLLDMSRILSGKLRMEVRPVVLQEIIDEATATVELAATAKHIVLRRSVEPDRLTVLGDAHRLQQVIWNLLSNAIKFTPNNGQVMITLRRGNNHAVVEVSDSGKGIAPKFLGKVFDRFSQAEHPERQKESGLGLGLAIVKQVVELHGGSVCASSEGEGRGATFAVTLPLAPGQEREAPAHLVSGTDRARLADGSVLPEATQ